MGRKSLFCPMFVLFLWSVLVRDAVKNRQEISVRHRLRRNRNNLPTNSS